MLSKNNEEPITGYFYVLVAQLCWLFATWWTVPHQDPLSIDFPGKNTGAGGHFLLSPGIEPGSPVL